MIPLSLRAAMCCKLIGWKNRLPPCWRELADDVRLDFDELGPARGKESLTCDSVWPCAGNIFKAFQNRQLGPSDVRVVILGKEPYPKAERATGRAFEQGDIISFDARKDIASSLRGLILAVLMTNCLDGKLDGLVGCENLGGQSELFDSWERQGVMHLNTSLTFSCERHSMEHRNLWRPFVAKIIRSLLNRPQNPVIFAPWGGEARNEMRRILPNQHNAVVPHNHPSSREYDFFVDGNPLLAINKKLRDLALPEIIWYPLEGGS